MDFRLQSSSFKLTLIVLLKVLLIDALLLQNVQKLHHPSSEKNKDKTDDKLCQKQVQLLVDGYQSKELWALNVFDSWGKTQSGMFSGNVVNFGHYEQCLQVKHYFDDDADGVFQGQHCMIFFSDTGISPKNSSVVPEFILPQVTHIDLIRQYLNVKRVRMGTAVCVPSLCNPTMVRIIADKMLASYSLKTTADYSQEIFCNIINIKQMRSIDMFAA